MLNIIYPENLGIATLPLKEREAEHCSNCVDTEIAHRPGPQLNGNLQVDPEIYLPSPGMDVNIAYFYNSNQSYNGPFGYGRTISTNSLAQAEATPIPSWVSFTRGDGSAVSYAYDSGSNSYQAFTQGLWNTLVSFTDGGKDYWKETATTGVQMVYPYNTDGQITSIIYEADAVGNRHTFSYSAGLLQTLEDAVGRQVSFTYAGGLLESIEDWAGRYTTFQYDTTSVAGKPLLATLIGPTGCQTGYGYDSQARLTRITDPNGYNTTYSYYGNGQVQSRTIAGIGTTLYNYADGQTMVTYPENGVLTHTLDGNWNITGLMNAAGVSTTVTYNSRGQITSQEDYYGGTTYTAYDVTGRVPVSTTDPLGHITTYQLDAYNNATTMLYADGSNTQQIYGYAGSPFDTTGAKRLLQVQVDALGNRTSYSYNSRGQMTAMQNPLGYVTSYGYDSLGNQITVTDALGNISTSVYDLAGNVIASIDPLGHTTSISYDAQNRPIAMMDALGNVSTTAYDSVGNVVVQIDPLGRRTSYSYDALNNQIETIDMQGNRTTNVYDGNGQQIATIDPLGYRTSNIYDLAGRVIATQDALGYLTTTIYDNAGRNVAMIDALGYYTTTVYDLASRVVGFVDAEGYISTTVYDFVNRPIANIDALGRVTSRTYDADGRLTAAIDPLGYTSTSIYDANSRPVAQINALGYATTSVYDALGRTITSIDALGYQVSMVYDAAGRNIATVDALGAVTTSVYDAVNRLIAMQDARGYVSSSIYDAAGQQIAMQDALGYLSTTVYDSLGRQQNTIDPLGNKSTFTYDAASQTIGIIDANGNCTTSVYDGAGQLISEVNALGFATTLVYDGVGQQTAVQDARGNSTLSVYDARGNVTATIDPLGRRTSYAYDAVDNQILRVDARGIATTYSYDPRDLLTGMQYPDGGRVTNAYDAIGRPAMMADSTGITTYSYDGDNRQSSVAYPIGKVLSYSYDGNGNRTQMQVDGNITSYNYDPNSNLIRIINPYSETTTFGYDALNREEQKTLANGVTINHTYDAAGREVLLEQRKADTTALAIYTATYDAVGIRTSMQELDGSVNDYSYDATYQLTNETRTETNAFSTTFTYDPTGNRLVQNADGTLTTSTYDAANQIVTATTNDEVTTFTSDANGNRIVENANGTLATYTWDAENRMTGAAEGTNTETFTYAGDGQRRSKSISTQDINYLWDEENILEELDGSDNLIAHYTDFPGYWGGLSSERLAGDESEFYLFDLLSSNRLLLDASAATSNEYLYKAFGEKVFSTGNVRNPFQFQGQSGPYSDANNRTWMRARIVDPTTGKWLSPDPIGFGGRDWNLYRFVENNPTNYVDPKGLLPWDDWFNTRGPRATVCAGRCGAQIDDWIANEIKSQLDGVTAWRRRGRTEYVHWANGNQRYKDADFFTFNVSLNNPPCGTGRCGSAVTLCGTCVKSAILGNIMYGFVGGYLNVPLWRLTQAASGTKQQFALPGRPPFTKYDEEAYKVGRKLWNRLAPRTRKTHYSTSQAFCQSFKPLVSKFPMVLRTVRGGEGGRRHGDYDDLTQCEPCPHKTKERRHGGKLNWEPWWP